MRLYEVAKLSTVSVGCPGFVVVINNAFSSLSMFTLLWLVAALQPAVLKVEWSRKFFLDVLSISSVMDSTMMTRLYWCHRLHSWKYILHCMYMKTTPPVNPMATTISFVQKAQSNWLERPSSAVRSMSTYSDHMTHVIAIMWNEAEQSSLRRSILFMLSFSQLLNGRVFVCIIKSYLHNSHDLIPNL